jgi:hypothetical protein
VEYLTKKQKLITAIVAAFCAFFCLAIQANAGEITPTRVYAKNITTTPASGKDISLNQLNGSNGTYSNVLDPAKTLATTLICIEIPEGISGTIYYSYVINTVGAAVWDFRTANDNHPVGTMSGTTMNISTIQRQSYGDVYDVGFNRLEDGRWEYTVARAAVNGCTAYADTFTNTLNSESSALVYLELKQVIVTNEGFDSQVYNQFKEVNKKLDNIQSSIDNIGEQEKQYAQEQATGSKNSSENAFGNYFNIGQNTTFWGYLTSFYNAINGEHVLTSFNIPAGNLQIMDETFHFWDSQAVDFGFVFQDENFQKIVIVVKGLQVLSAGALVVFYAFRIRSWIVNYDESTADVANDIPFLPGGGNF